MAAMIVFSMYHDWIGSLDNICFSVTDYDLLGYEYHVGLGDQCSFRKTS